MSVEQNIRYLVSRVKGARHRLKFYFANEKAIIAEKNLSTLKVISVWTLILGVLLSLIAPLLVPHWVSTKEYFCIIPTLLIFIVFSFLYSRKTVHSYYVVQAACILFYILMFCHLIDLSVFSYPTDPETYISCFIILMPVLFIIRPYIVLAISLVCSIVFSELVLNYKTGVAVTHDRFALVASFTFSLFTMYIIYKLRLKDFDLRERYMTQSRTDLLTGLLNKCSYESFCKMALSERLPSTPCALFVFDVDDFKKTNDTYGHLTGDRALEIIGSVLLDAFRCGDLVGRIGGDEFSAMILPSADIDVLTEKARRVRDEVNERTKDELGIVITMSTGIAVNRNANVTYEQLFAAADGLLYTAKDLEIERIVTKTI